MLHPYADALRYFDVALGVALWIGLAERFWVRSRPSLISGPWAERIAMRTAIISWGLLSVSRVASDIYWLHTKVTVGLGIGVLGHLIGVVYCVTAWSMDKETKKKVQVVDTSISTVIPVPESEGQQPPPS